MKKILFAFALVAGFSAASYAQSSSTSSSAAAEPPKVEVAGEATHEAVATDKASAPSSKSSSTKSCCSHKSGKEASCADGKKAKASKSDMKEEEKPNN